MIPIKKLKEYWTKEGPFGPWRALLKEGYLDSEFYFEFGVLPVETNGCDFKIIVDHSVPVWICSDPASNDMIFSIQPYNGSEIYLEVFSHPMLKRMNCYSLFVSQTDYKVIINEIDIIYQDYQDEEIVSFWSIPNKWFANFNIIALITDYFLHTEEYKRLTAGNKDFYWP